MVVIIIIFIIGAGFVLVKSGEDSQPARTEEEKTVSSEGFPGELPESERVGKNIRIETEKGIIEFELYGKEAPKTVSNFITLTKKGFYDGLTFHRREEGFLIQKGDPKRN